MLAARNHYRSAQWPLMGVFFIWCSENGHPTKPPARHTTDNPPFRDLHANFIVLSIIWLKCARQLKTVFVVKMLLN